MTDSIRAATAEQVRDGYVNTTTGVGTVYDKSKGGAWAYPADMDDVELEMLFHNNDLAALICEKIVEDALRDGFSIKRPDSPPEQDAELTKKVMKRFVELQAGENRFMRAAVWGRLFGGGGLLLGVRGSGDWNTPLDLEKVTSIEFIKDFDKQQMFPLEFGETGQVEIYRYNPEVLGNDGKSTPEEGVDIHHSRIIFFPGARTSTKKKRERRGWDLSVLQRVRGALLSFDSMMANTDTMFADASQAVFHLQGFIEALGEDTGKTDVDTRLRLMNMFRSASRAIVLDAGDENGAGKEEFQVVDRQSLGGLDKVMEVYMVRLAAAARMPLTVLLGMAPAGMDATGESDMILYYSTVDIYRKQVLAERLLKLLKIIAKDVENNETEQEGAETDEFERPAERAPASDDGEWEIVWPELTRPKPLDVATAENMRITSALALVTSQAWTPEEVALNMDVIAPTMGVRIDLEPRRKALEAAHSEIEERTLGLGAMEAQGEVATENAIKLEKAKPKAAPPASKQSERKTPSKAAKRQV